MEKQLFGDDTESESDTSPRTSKNNTNNNNVDSNSDDEPREKDLKKSNGNKKRITETSDDDDDNVSEKKNSASEEEEDLFGEMSDDEEDGGKDKMDVDSDDDNDQSNRRKGSTNLERELGLDYSGDEDDNEDVEELEGTTDRRQEERRPVREELVEKVSLPKLISPIINKSELSLLKLPNFLTFEPKPYDRETFVAGKTDEEKLFFANNTIRWRYAKDEDGNVLPDKKESNARFIRWSDNSMSLLLGNELFNATLRPTTGHHYFLTHQPPFQNASLLQTTSSLSKQMLITPHSENQASHKRLTYLVSQRYKKETKTQMIKTDIDPERLRAEAERLENEKIRMKKRLESKKRNMRNRQADYLGNSDLEDDYDRDYDRGNRDLTRRLNGYAYDDEESEVDNDYDDSRRDDTDDEEDEERERRIKNAKKRTLDSSDDEAEGGDVDVGMEKLLAKQLEEDSDEDESRAVAKKKRKVVDTDDDDE